MGYILLPTASCAVAAGAPLIMTVQHLQQTIHVSSARFSGTHPTNTMMQLTRHHAESTTLVQQDKGTRTLQPMMLAPTARLEPFRLLSIICRVPATVLSVVMMTCTLSPEMQQPTACVSIAMIVRRIKFGNPAPTARGGACAVSAQLGRLALAYLANLVQRRQRWPLLPHQQRLCRR